ncbi:centromere protein F isoform X2 [Brienomyrus brachyistius]|uniref:centromere protein F isoform X2 n=1 Tax=Brienomyrus brachyistius TaxID=42636 RepID=UPI0020B3DA50|nr:centromere protein F isoform X2 [Brienomyrus brachyistius]
MSWAGDEWKDGLPGKALQKIQEIEGQLDKLKKERQQKQFQMDSLEAALQKQKQKVDVEKNEVSVLKRENQSLVESCESLEKTRQRITHELQVKEQQVNYLEGQMSSSRKQTEKLEQDIKRYKNELDRTQPGHSMEMQPSSTPQKMFATPVTPSHRQFDLKFEELQDKYNKEVEERKRMEAELKVLQVKLLNQSSASHKDIARQQTQSSIFPWQQQQTLSCHSSFTETPLKRKTAPPSFPWELEDTPMKQNSQSISVTQSESSTSEAIELLRATNQDLKAKVSELELHLQSHEKEMKNQINKFQEIQSQLDKTKKDLNEKETVLIKCREDLTKVSGQYEQAVTKCSSVEQKLKQLTEEMNCQRHNAESSRRALEQKLKDQEKENQKEHNRQQNSQLALEQQLNQTKTKMSQELQQAKKDHAMLQADIDKVTAQKNHLEKDLGELKAQLCRSEQALQASQTKEVDLKKKSEEMQRENNNLGSKLEQNVKRLSEVEEQLKTVRQDLKQSDSVTKDLKAKTQAQSEELKGLQTKLESQTKSSTQDLESLKIILADLEMKKEASEKEIQKQRVEMEQMANKTTVLEKEHQELNLNLKMKQNECDELKTEAECILKWKNEKESLINNIETEREMMLNRIGELEKDIVTLNDTRSDLNEKLKNVENEREILMRQIDSLKGDLLNKCVELEEKERVHNELQYQLKEADQKHSKDLDNTAVQITLLQGKLTELEARLQQETSKLENLQRSHTELLTQYENACDLAKSKDSVIELNQNEITHLRESLDQALAYQEQQLVRFTEEKSSLMKEYETNLSEKTEEAEQAKLNFEKSQQELPLLNDQIASLALALKHQKHLTVELQTKYDVLSNANDDLQDKISKAEKNEEKVLHEMSILSEQAKTMNSLQEQLSTLSAAEEESKCALQEATEALNLKVNELQTLSGNALDVKKQVKEIETKASNLEKENVHLEEKVKWLEKCTEELLSKNQSLQEANHVLCEEKACLLREKAATEDLTLMAEKKLEASSQHCVELTCLVEDLQVKYASAVKLNSKLESSLKDQSDQKSLHEQKMNVLTAKQREESERHSQKIKDHEEKQKNLMEKLVAVNLELQDKSSQISEMNTKLENSQSEMLQVRRDITVANDELVKLNDSYKIIVQERDCWMEKEVSNLSEIESLRAALTTVGNSMDQKEDLIQMLRKNICDAELEQVRLTQALKEKDLTMNKIKVQLEMLQMDLDDNEIYMNSFDSKMEGLQGTISSLETKLEVSELQRSTTENELSSLREKLTLKNNEISKIKSHLEDVCKNDQNPSALNIEIESLLGAKSNLQAAIEEEILRYSNLEKIYNELSEINSKLRAKVENLQHQLHDIQEQNDRLKQENDGLKELLQIQKNEYQCLKSPIAKMAEHNKTNLKNKVFEEEQMTLHQRFVVLQSEYTVMKEQYSSLLSQVSEQQSLIEQLGSEGGHKAECEGDASQSVSSFVDISLSNEEESDGMSALDDHKECDVLHSSATIEDSSTEPRLPCEGTLLGSVSSSSDGGSGLRSATDNIDGIVCSFDGPALHLQQEQIHLHLSSRCVLSPEDQATRSEELEASSFTSGRVMGGLDGLMEAEQEVSKNELVELPGSEREDLDHLQKQHFHEVQSWRQKLVDLSLEMETKLAAERQHAAALSAELEAARLRIQGLDLSSRSLLCDDDEESVLQLQSHSSEEATPHKKQKPEIENCKEHASLGISSLQDGSTDEMPPNNENQTASISQKDNQEQLEGENKGTIQRLQEEIQALHSQLELLAAENNSRKELCTQMEMTLREQEEEKSDSVDKLMCTIVEKQKAHNQLKKLEEEVDTLKLQLQASKCQLDITEILEAEVAKADWDEQVLQLQSDLKRVQSEKANLENHILSMETDIEEMLKGKQKLEQELEASRKINVSLEQNLNIVTTEGIQLKQELLSCTEEREKAGQSFLNLKEKVEWLEKENIEVRELNKIIEADIRRQKKESEVASNNLGNLQEEKKQLLTQLEDLEQAMSLISAEKDGLLKALDHFKEQQHDVSQSSEATMTKMQTLEMENARWSHLLESSLLEKGEIASRLNSTQEEVIQMRVGIEKLRVKIESDERKKHQMGELLKDAQRKADMLQDKLERLEKETEMTEQSLEDAILQAETAKAEFEELQTEKVELIQRFEQMTADQNDLRSEKGRLEREVVQKTEQLQKIERQVKEVEVNLNVATEELQSKLSAMGSQLQICQKDLESMQLKEQDLTYQLSSLECENVQLSEKLQETQQLQLDMQSKTEMLDEELVMKQSELKVSFEEIERLQQQVAELQTIKEDKERKQSLLQSEKEELERGKMHLQSVVAELEQKVEVTSAKCEIMQITMSSLESNVQQREEYLQAARLTNAELSEKVDVLNKQNLKLQNEITAALSSAEELRIALEMERHSHSIQQQSTEQQMERFKLTIENLSTEKEELMHIKENLELDVKKDTVKLQKQIQQVDELSQKVTQLSKEKDSAHSKLALWMESCKQLEKEKQLLLVENEQQGTLITTLQSKEKQGEESGGSNSMQELQMEIQELKGVLEERTREADESTDKYCSLLVSLHKLEEANETLQNQVSHLTSQLASKSRSTSKTTQNPPITTTQKEEEAGSKQDGQVSGKRQRAPGPDENEEASKAQEALHNISKKIRACATPQASRQPQVEEEFRPEGLPELVKKGFADIPVGEASPFIMRRTVARRCSPRLAAKKSPVPLHTCQTPNPAVHYVSQSTEGSSQQELQETKPLKSPARSTSGVLVSVTNSPKIADFDSPVVINGDRKGRRSLSIKRTPEQRDKCRRDMALTDQDENCHVQ